MRSTRHKLKMLRGISRISASGGVGGSPYRKRVHYQHSSSFHLNSVVENGPANSPILNFEPPTTRRSRPRIKPYNHHNPTSHLLPLSNPVQAQSLSIDSRALQKNYRNNNNEPSPPPRCYNQTLHWPDTNSANMDDDLNDGLREKAFSICQDYLHGVWKQIDLRDLVVKRISGGLSNYLYHCSLPSTLPPLYTEPIQVLLRFYGQVHGEGALESLITESVIFTLLSERKLGPRLHGVFPGGRVEEFIPARPLTTMELRNSELSCLIAQKMAQIHALNIPISKEPSWLWGTIERWMANVQESLVKQSVQDSHHAKIVEKLKEFHLEDELIWLKKYLPQVESPVVFSHNDLQEGNILIRPEYEVPDDKLVLIDFEYCSYNYRGFDLANHFCEWSYNYSVDLYPNFAYEPRDLPSDEEKLRFIRKYVKVLRKEYKLNFHEIDEQFLNNSTLFDEKHILQEVDAFTLASHFFWSLWAFVNAQVSKIPFGYWEYGQSRLEAYFAHKQRLL